ncbi:protein of unknown function [Streptococcus thermophilus]|uniref:Uncharacterized protein n=1 Tax=Streptococcus thermophilus TaxID=1308 RepID=A0AAU9H5L7_STRTR|nr:protein of unknown function [Streptococcus thermophilus]CAD0125212.1 protein of unknown function [Streptococcus thermophilus]CAD0125351.1 protein of unknown function [Streptococcus thermophilus]CAD0133566.1 protein of unknown function [Streptococcus thermophilus]CAD0135720.1 protein of unknown function [Streptococcus thermophilus]
MWYNKYPKHMKEQTMKKTDYAYYDLLTLSGKRSSYFCSR